MERTAEATFVLQQGFRDASAADCQLKYPALMWQPRVIGVIVLAGLITQASPLFLGLSALLFWNALLPMLNPFDAIYNRLIASPKDLPRLGPAPGPRRFAQALAATFSLGIASSLFLGWSTAALVLEAFLVAALAALIFGRFCLGSYIFLVLTGESRFANRTLPWSRIE
jgi:hypothetical protein